MSGTAAAHKFDASCMLPAAATGTTSSDKLSGDVLTRSAEQADDGGARRCVELWKGHSFTVDKLNQVKNELDKANAELHFAHLNNSTDYTRSMPAVLRPLLVEGESIEEEYWRQSVLHVDCANLCEPGLARRNLFLVVTNLRLILIECEPNTQVLLGVDKTTALDPEHNRADRELFITLDTMFSEQDPDLVDKVRHALGAQKVEFVAQLRHSSRFFYSVPLMQVRDVLLDLRDSTLSTNTLIESVPCCDCGGCKSCCKACFLFPLTCLKACLSILGKCAFCPVKHDNLLRGFGSLLPDQSLVAGERQTVSIAKYQDARIVTVDSVKATKRFIRFIYDSEGFPSPLTVAPPPSALLVHDWPKASISRTLGGETADHVCMTRAPNDVITAETDDKSTSSSSLPDALDQLIRLLVPALQNAAAPTSPSTESPVALELRVADDESPEHVAQVLAFIQRVLPQSVREAAAARRYALQSEIAKYELQARTCTLGTSALCAVPSGSTGTGV